MLHTPTRYTSASISSIIYPFNFNEFIKSQNIVIPVADDLASPSGDQVTKVGEVPFRVYPERIKITGFRIKSGMTKQWFLTFYDSVNFNNMKKGICLLKKCGKSDKNVL